MRAGCARTGSTDVEFRLCILSLDDSVVETMLFSLLVITLYLVFKLGYPAFKLLSYEIDVFQYTLCKSHTVTLLN